MKRLIEIALIELIIFLLLWFWNGFLAFYLTVALTFICFFILIIALIAEWIEASKVKRIYFYAMTVSIIIPWISAAIVYILDLNITVF
ncbi:MAG: hypothetical protein AB8G11_12845 [Saprospiraceae bacterium]